MRITKYILTVAVYVLCGISVAGAQGLDLPDPQQWPENRDVSLPIANQVARKYTTGSSITLTGEEISKYPSIDFRNLLTGLFPGVDIRELDGNPEIYNGDDRVQIFSRGRSSIEFVLDDVPVALTMIQLDPQEIESITFVKDIVDKSMYGPTGANGILYIKTKKGIPNTRTIQVTLEKGISFADRVPEWVNGEEYARLNNIARANEGLSPLYSDEAIAHFALKDPAHQRYPNTDLRSMLLDDTKSYSRANVVINGGSNAVRYNVSVGYAGEGDIYKVGSTASYDRLNVRTSLDARIIDGLEANVSFHAGMTFRQTPNYGNSNHQMATLMSDLASINPLAYPLTLRKFENEQSELADSLLWRTIYGISSLFGKNPYAQLLEGGAYTVKGRSGTTNATLTYDFGTIGVRGLKSRTFFNVSTFLMTRIGKSPDYLAYIWDPATGESNTMSSNHQGAKVSGKSLMANNTNQNLTFIQQLSFDRRLGDHMVNGSLSYYLLNVHRKSNTNRERQQNVILSAIYAYKDRYVFNGVLTHAGSSMFAKGRQYKTFPSAGIGWIVSEEPFMKNIRWIDHLKLRAQAGLLGYENFGSDTYFLDSYAKGTGLTFGPSASGDGTQWFGTETRSSSITDLNRLGNPELSWEIREEYSAGIETWMVGRRLYFEANGFYHKRKGILTEMTAILPNVFGLANTTYYANHNSTLDYGCELTLHWRDRIGQLFYSLGGSVTVSDSEYLAFNEERTYDYQNRVGKATDSYWGYVYQGKFTSQADIVNSVKMASQSNASPGDLKYLDVNGDDIVDSNDQIVIGHTTPRMFYSVTLNLAYRNFDFTMVGTGRALYDIPITNVYFQNNLRNDHYSAFVRDNMDDAYPRLTYNSVTGNFVNSSYWLRAGGYFKIQNAELGYNVPLRDKNRIGIRGLRLFARGANLLTISRIKDVDPESINSGVTRYPLFRTFTGGVKMTF